jgi:predicted nucleotidyltransferase
MLADPALVEALRSALAGRKDVKLALLFGSRARGRFRPDSDVDVAYLGRDVDPLELASQLSEAVRREVQAVGIADASYPLLQAVLRDGILLHQGEPGAEARWRSHTIAQLETDRPWFERMRDAYLKRLAEGRHG